MVQPKKDFPKESLLKKVKDRGEIDVLDDGFYYYFPNDGGAIFAHQLRSIADELDRLNEPLEKELNEYFENN